MSSGLQEAPGSTHHLRAAEQRAPSPAGEQPPEPQPYHLRAPSLDGGKLTGVLGAAPTRAESLLWSRQGASWGRSVGQRSGRKVRRGL